MKTTLKILFMLISITIISCGGHKKEKLTLPEPPTGIQLNAIAKVDGELTDYIEAIPGTYKFEISKEEITNNYQGTVKVKFKAIRSKEISSSSSDQYGAMLYGTVLDGNNSPQKFELSGCCDYDAISGLIKQGNGEGWVSFSVQGQGLINSEEDANKMLESFKQSKTIQFSSKIVAPRGGSSSSSTSSSSSSGNCDEFLEGYKKFMLKYVEIMKKYKDNPNDAAILSDYSSVMSEAAKWTAKGQNCQGDPKIAAKILEIQAEILNAAK